MNFSKFNFPRYSKKLYNNSGFNKGFWEKTRDSIVDKTAEWTIGTLITGIITGTAAYVVYLLFGR